MAKHQRPLDKYLADYASGKPREPYISPLQRTLAAHARARALGEEWTICTKCQEPKPRYDGYNWCEVCREQRRLEQRAHREKHREAINARSLASYHRNKGPSLVQERQERKAAEWETLAEEGLAPCQRCHKPKDMYDGYSQCEACRKYAREYKARKR